jgi:hypothetical protein
MDALLAWSRWRFVRVAREKAATSRSSSRGVVEC